MSASGQEPSFYLRPGALLLTARSSLSNRAPGFVKFIVCVPSDQIPSAIQVAQFLVNRQLQLFGLVDQGCGETQTDS